MKDELHLSCNGKGDAYILQSEAIHFNHTVVLEFQTKHDVMNPTIIAKMPYQIQNTGSLKNSGFESIWLLDKKGGGGN